MLLVAAPPLRCAHLSLGAAALMAIYVALLIGFVVVAANAPPSTVIFVGG